MTVTAFYPDSHAESTSVDGFTKDDTAAGETWATKYGTSTSTNANSNSADVDGAWIRCDGNTDEWDIFSRGHIVFDTSGLPDGDSVSAGTLALTASNVVTNLSGLAISLVGTTLISNTNIATGDFDGQGSTRLATDVALSGIASDSTTPFTFTLNAAGIASISLTGVSPFGTLIDADLDNSEPTWSSGDAARVVYFSADEGEAGDERPVLTITHAEASTTEVFIIS